MAETWDGEEPMRRSSGAALSSRPTNVCAAEAISTERSLSKPAPRWGGGGDKCVGCLKTVYAAEKAVLGTFCFHIDCARCMVCNKKVRYTRRESADI